MGLEINIDDLFKDEEPETTSEQESETQEDAQEDMRMPDTKAVSKRINEVRAKTERDTRESVAKQLGYESYEAMMKESEKKVIKEAGLDEEDVESVVSKIVEQRFANDPRLKKLEDYEAREKQMFVTSQLSEVNKLSGKNYTAIDQLPEDTLKLWEQIGDLKKAYLATQGEELLRGKRAATPSDTKHLSDSSQSANPSGSGTRKLTEDEKKLYKRINPYITDEELSKKTINI